MDDPHFDHKSAKRFDRQRASGPFGVDEILPKKILTWVNRKHPDSGKRQTLLNFTEWQRGQAARILQDFELHVYEWTLTAVKHRESLDKQDKRDVAQSVFAQDRDGRLSPHMLFLRAQTLEREDDDEAAAEQNAINLPAFRVALVDDLILADDNDIVERDRAILMTGVEMTRTEFDLLLTLIRIFDHSRSHFVFEICEPPTKRFLNALRIREEENGDRMPWAQYKVALLERMQNSSTIDGLISFILKPRDNSCPIGLWVAERIAERRLLNDDGIDMSEDTWLELLLSFITNEEKQTLQVPARDQRAAFDNGAGYDVLTLQRSLNRFDPTTFRKFQQTHCHDPVALRVLSLHKLVAAENAAPAPKTKKAGLESHAAAKPGMPPKAKANEKFDKKQSLPAKEGKPDQELYASFPEKSLRRRLWDAVVAGKCPRCSGPHLRIACPKPRQGWEDDFEKEDFFTKSPPPSKQVRVQLAGHQLNLPAPQILSVLTPLGRCLIDSCSDVSVARRDVLIDVHPAAATIAVGHLGGETLLTEIGTLQWQGGQDESPVVVCEVFVVEPEGLPAGVVALLGVGDIRRLGISLDAVLANPDRDWERAVPLSLFSRVRRACRRLFAGFFATSRTPQPGTLRYSREQSEERVPLRAVELPRYEAAPPRTPEADHAGRELLAATKRQLSDEQARRTAHRIAQLFREGQARKKQAKATKAEARSLAPDKSGFAPVPSYPASHRNESSSTEAPFLRRRAKFYAVRRGRRIGVFATWEECQQYTTGYANAEFKRFDTMEEARHYLLERRLNFMAFRRPPKPDSSFVGGKALRAQLDVWQDGHADSTRTECGLDTMSDVNMALAELLHDVHDIVIDRVNGCAGRTVFAREGTLKVLHEGEVHSLPALVASASQLPRSCEVLLGVPGLDALGVSTDLHRKKQRQPLICHVGEKTLRTWWEANEGQAAPAIVHDISQVDVCPDLPAAAQAQVRNLLRLHEGVFEGRQITMPKPFQSEPVELKFIDDPVPQSIPEPRWTHAQKNVLTQWAQAGLKDGSLELSTSRWASRPHIVMKTPASQHKDLVDISKCKLRVCGDYRAVNTQIAKIVPNLPTGLEEVEKAAGHRLYWESDSVACYSQFTLAPGRSREALAVWTPLGLVQPTTLPFGQKNSGTEAQGPYRAAASEMQRGRHGNYVDDWIGYSNDLDQLIDDFGCFLRVCEKYGITLGIGKTRFGYGEAQFFGFRVNHEGSHLAFKHLDPLRNLVPPVDIHELRRVLGLFVVSRKYLQDYALISRPMTEVLKGKPPTFRWGPEQQTAFETIRDKLLQGVHLAAPDFSLPFHLATDASEDGKGGEFYQLPSIPIADQYPYNVKTHAPENHAVIFFLSKAFDETQRLRPPFYLEGDSLLWCTLKTKYYALSSPFPLYTYSDHMPLKWMEKTEKGPISSFIVENLSEFETIHQYIQGKNNTLPDSCSRYPMLGPKRLATRGLANSVAEMLRRLPTRLKDAPLVHFHGGKQNAELREALKDWFVHVSALQPVTPPSKSEPPTADLAILLPRCEVAPVALARYLLSEVPFALLMPVDLLAMASTPNLYRQSPHDEIAAKFAKAGKITILATQMTWVIGNLEDCHPIEMFAAALRTPAPVTGFASRTYGSEEERKQLDEDDLNEVEGTVPRTIEAWVRAQKMDDGFGDFAATVEDAALRDELWIQAPPGRTPTIIVPEPYQELLVRDAHGRMHHLNHAKVYALLRQSYFFPAMKKQIRQWLENCPECELTKARQNTAHALFHSAPVHAPRARWCMDFQGQGTATTGESEALALIDPTSRYVIVIPLRDRQASTWLQPFLDRVVFTFGAPDCLHSDDAPEFVSEALDLLAKAADIRTTTTLGHNARGNATIEVWWRFWNRCMRLLSDDAYMRWPEFAQRIAFAHNTAVHEGLNAVTPFAVYHGSEARNTLVSSLATAPALSEDEELVLPAQFAEAVALSTRAFTAMAKTHDEFVRTETARRLNEKGSSRVFQVGDKVKVRVPPTQAQLLETGRRAKHVTAWRGPCTILERLSTTAYAAIDDTTKRRYERVIANILPFRATKAKTNANANFNEVYSTPFVVGEFIAVRDEPKGPFFIALVDEVSPTQIVVLYHGTTGVVLAEAVFKPCWHEVGGHDIILDWKRPEDTALHQYLEYTGEIALKDIHTVLVARDIQFTKAGKLRFRALRSLVPVHDQLFRFAK